jgi:hypothetical protein
MVNPKVLEAWYTLMAEAMRGTNDAQDAVKKLSEMSSTPEDLNKWMNQFMPGAAKSFSFQPEGFEDQLENWWRMMGVVPRSRYLELLEKCDTLERKLNKAEETISSLRQRQNRQEQQDEDTKKVINMWGSMMEETMKTQAEWMKAWSTAPTQPGGSEDQTDPNDESGGNDAPAEEKSTN